VLAVAFFVVAQSVAEQAARGFRAGDGYLLLRNLFLLFMEVIGFGAMGLLFDRQRQPLRAMGLLRQPDTQAGAVRQFAMGAALGWGMVAALVLPVALSGGLYVHLWLTPRAFLLCAEQLAALAAAALANEIAFRGYPFQRLMEFSGPVAATLLACIVFGLLRSETPDAGTAGIWVSVVAALLLTLAYLRTRALWLPWGLHFAWLASMGVLFGLPLAGNTDASTVIQGNAYGPHWLTGGDYGPEGGWLAFWVLLAAVFVLLRMTRQIAWRMQQPILHPAGIAVEIGQHPPVASSHAAPAPASGLTSGQKQAAAPSLVQIVPLTTPPAPGAFTGATSGASLDTDPHQR
jgi:membrane protease YdiL (CAAX protease family)